LPRVTRTFGDENLGGISVRFDDGQSGLCASRRGLGSGPAGNRVDDDRDGQCGPTSAPDDEWRRSRGR
jgi:hypothetical protein